MNNHIIQIFNLKKVYKLKGKEKQIVALDNVNLNIKEGEKFGLLGPNGAGKTTLTSILTTLIQPTEGYALVDGFNILKSPTQVRKRVGLMLSSEMVYNRITGYHNLKFFAKIYQIKNYQEKILSITKELELDKWLNQYVGKYSTGMKVKLSLARILLTSPKILFLDEPTLGLDVKVKSFIINKLKNLDKTIFFASHDMGAVEKLSDRVAFINNGQIIKVGNKEELSKLMQKGIRINIDIEKKKSELIKELNQNEFILKTNETNKGIEIFLKERIYYKDLISTLKDYSILKLNEETTSIEELFLNII
ncbi:MAG: ABC transporter ATP-binding protein [Promethearchaeota archaeon]